MQPRFYSISSSPKYILADIHLTVGLVEYMHNNNKRYGLCTKWINDELKEDDLIPVFIRG